MTKPAPRRPSRITTSKPRKIAGKDATSDEPARPAEPTPRPAPRKAPVVEEPAPADDGASSPAPLDSPRITHALLVLVGVLVLLLLLQAAWFLLNERRDVLVSPAAQETNSQGDEEEYQPIVVPSGGPVALDPLAVQEGVEAAAAAAQIMFTRDYKSYDDGVENAITLMTDEFAEQYRQTTTDVRPESIRTKTQVEIRVVAQSVVRASDAELEALIFLNQYTIKGEGRDATTTYTPYRAVLKMVHTDKGWLVDGVDTR